MNLDQFKFVTELQRDYFEGTVGDCFMYWSVRLHVSRSIVNKIMAEMMKKEMELKNNFHQ